MSDARSLITAEDENRADTARGGLVSWMKARLRQWQRRYEHRAALAVLRALDDRMLKDIGLDRSEIMSMSHGRLDDATRRSRGWSGIG